MSGVKKNLDIENFGSRLDWMAWSKLRHDPDCRRLPNAQSSPPNSQKTWRALVAQIKFPGTSDDDAVAENGPIPKGPWSEYCNGKRPVPEDVIDAICKVYPAMPRDILAAPDYATFEAKAAELLSGRDSWATVAATIAADRGRLAELGKAYHAGVDQAPGGFPLILRDGWLLPRPQELREDDQRLPRILARQTAPEPVALPGWPATYMALQIGQMDGRTAGKQFNGSTFRLMDVTPLSGDLDLTLTAGRYYDYINTCEVLGAELAAFALDHPDIDPGPGNLPLRGDPGDAFRLWSRSAALGVNCLCILKGYDGKVVGDPSGDRHDVFLMHRRDKRTIEAQEVWHVVPAGGHSPASIQCPDPREVGLWWTVAREFVEECFNVEEAKLMKTDKARGFMGDFKAQAVLNATLRNPAVGRVFLLGLGLDPVTLKPEALVAVVIDWAKAKADCQLPHDKRLAIIANDEGKIEARLLEGPGSLRQAAVVGADGITILPAAAGSLQRAAELYDDLTSWLL